MVDSHDPPLILSLSSQTPLVTQEAFFSFPSLNFYAFLCGA